ncbi:hypothetical protein BJ166DRAFT_190854 [Pestalotiopsis sp. NC0098]|nr:hypothetical protein BJ166DRAFT_190854 [Pestalotiopsis sp. NC0098]
MAEALAALSIACNVLSVVDFTWTLLTEAREIYKAESGASGNVVFLETIVNDIKDHDDRLADASTGDPSLQKLISSSRDITAQISAALTSMKEEDHRSKWKSFKAALKELWGDRKINELAEKVSTLQTRIARHMLMTISHEVKETGRNVKETIRNVGALSARFSNLETINHQIGTERKELLTEMESNLIKAVEDSLADRVDFERFVKAIIHKDNFVPWRERLQGSGQILTAAHEFSEAAELTRQDQDFLRSLRFRNQKSRYQNIPDAHSRTFEWILENDIHQEAHQSTSTFKDWLETGSGIYWISGKPGSGKSTLMKFLWNNERTEKLLHVWADGKPLVTANFYFWNAGSALQKSQEGLLRSIIFEILQNCPDLIPAARSAVDLQADFAGGNVRWQVQDLLSIYAAIVTHHVDTKFCLFIDGLDEFGEERRIQRDLLGTIRRLNYSPNIKLCLSSRPWTEFLDEFGNDRNHLKLEDLTRDDIERYVTDHFKTHPQFEVLNAQNSAYGDFIQSVLDRAQGVFLWVSLVMRELLKGLTHHDSLKTLQTRLDHFPPDLDKFFKHLIGLVDPIYHKQMAQYFHAAILVNRALPGRYFSFMDDLEDNEAPTLDGMVCSMKEEEALRRESQLIRRLDARSRGLLELKYPTNLDDSLRFWCCEVQFLHRTVYDFLRESRDIQDLLQRKLGDENTSLRVCEAILISSKTVPVKEDPVPADNHLIKSWDSEREIDYENLIYFGSLCVEAPGCDEKLQNLLFAAEEADNDVCATHKRQARPDFFLGIGAAIGFYSYLDSNLKARPHLFGHNQRYTNSDSLLYRALCGVNGNSFDCVTLLLENGADPNEIASTKSRYPTWHSFLRHVRWKDSHMDQTVLYELSQLLIKYGADFTVVSRMEGVISPKEILTGLLGSQMTSQLHEQILEKQSGHKVLAIEETTHDATSDQSTRQKKRWTFRLCWWF